jgi:hypothetical protein
MAVWIAVVGKQLGQENMKRLKLIGETWRQIQDMGIAPYMNMLIYH